MQGQKPAAAEQGPIFEAVEAHNWQLARYELAKKLARTLDATDSARDVKGTGRELAAVLDRVEQDERMEQADGQDTPLARILSMADSAKIA